MTGERFRARVARSLRTWAVLSTLLVALPAPLAAQGGETAEEVTRSFARAWADPDSGDLKALFDSRGVLFAHSGREHRDLDLSRLMATVVELREGAVGGGVRVLRVVPVSGAADQAFAELAWEAVMEGTSEAVVHTLYLGLRARDGRWWVSELRVLS